MPSKTPSPYRNPWSKTETAACFGRNELPVNINEIHNASRPWTIAKDKCILIADQRNLLHFIDQESMGLLWKGGRMMPTLHGVLSYG